MKAKFIHEFHKTGDPLRSLSVGISGILKAEDAKHRWYWDPAQYGNFKYDYFNPEIYDIVNYYGNFIKIIQFNISNSSGTKIYVAVSEELGYADINPKTYDTPEEALDSEISFNIELYGKDLILSNKVESVSGRIKVPTRTTLEKTS